MIPTPDVGESRLDTDIRLDQPGDLLQRVTESALVLSTAGWSVWIPIDGFDHLHRFERFPARRHEPRIGRRRVHRLEDGGHFFISRFELLEVVDCHGLAVATERTWQLGADGNRAKGRHAWLGGEGAIEPTVFARLSGRSGFHEVLSIEMRACRIR